MNNTYFFHLNNHKNRQPGRKKKPSCTIAAVRDGDSLVFGASKCSKDDAFCKKTGRELALTNVREGGVRFDIPDFFLKSGEIAKYFVKKAEKLVKEVL